MIMSRAMRGKTRKEWRGERGEGRGERRYIA
jgi:hypothetical protein